MVDKTEELFLIMFCSVIVIITVVITSIMLSPQYRESIKEQEGTGIDSRKIDITILEDKIVCEDVSVFNLNKEIRGYSFYEASSDQIGNLKILINDNENYPIFRKNGYIFFDTVPTNQKIKVKLKYELEKDYIARYTNTDLFQFYVDLNQLDYLKDLTINLHADETLSNLTVNKAKVENNSNNKYTINAKNLKNSTFFEIQFNIDAPINNIIDSEFVDRETLSTIEFYSYVEEKKVLLSVFITISILLFMAAFIINRKKRINKYIRETDNLLSPIFAEAIIDGTIGIKEMIMSTIINLNVKGNIKIINDDMLELVSLNNLESYEKNIVELIFKRNIITFNDIHRLFTKSNIENVIFTKKINNIMNAISQKMFSDDIFSKQLTRYNKIIKFLASFFILNLPFLFIDSFTELIIIFNVIFILFNIKKNIVKNPSPNKQIFSSIRFRSGEFLVITLIFINILAISSIDIARYYTEFFITTMLTIILNLYTAYLCRGFALTPNGREEQAKLKSLKKYMLDYSLIKERDLNSTLIWDEYLAYATAFGIPNKVTKKIDENCYNIRLNLIVFDNLI